MSTENTIQTIGEIARTLGVPTHRVKYIVDRDSIQHSVCGGYRLFDAAAREQIASALAKIDQRSSQ